MISGAKYFLKDKVLNEIIEVQILNINDVELSYKNLENGEEFYREIEEVEMSAVIDEEEARKLNNQDVFSIQTELVRAVLGRNEIIKYSKNNFKDINIDENTVLISITDPDQKILDKKVLEKFKDSLSIQFWDLERNHGEYNVISKEQSKQIKEFILDNKNNNFVIHCEAGISRSAGVAMAVFMLIEFNGNKYNFSTSPNPIRNHYRYHPNLKVFDMIVDSW